MLTKLQGLHHTVYCITLLTQKEFCGQIITGLVPLPSA